MNAYVKKILINLLICSAIQIRNFMMSKDKSNSKLCRLTKANKGEATYGRKQTKINVKSIKNAPKGQLIIQQNNSHLSSSINPPKASPCKNAQMQKKSSSKKDATLQICQSQCEQGLHSDRKGTQSNSKSTWKKNISMSNRILKEIMNYSSSNKHVKASKDAKTARLKDENIAPSDAPVLSLQNHNVKKSSSFSKPNSSRNMQKSVSQSSQICNKKQLPDFKGCRCPGTGKQVSFHNLQEYQHVPVTCSVQLNPFGQDQVSCQNKGSYSAFMDDSEAQDCHAGSQSCILSYRRQSRKMTPVSTGTKQSVSTTKQIFSNKRDSACIIAPNQHDYDDVQIEHFRKHNCDKQIESFRVPLLLNQQGCEDSYLANVVKYSKDKSRNLASNSSQDNEKNQNSRVTRDRKQESQRLIINTKEFQQLCKQQERIKSQAISARFVPAWDRLIECQYSLGQIDQQLPKICSQYETIRSTNDQLQAELIQLNRDYVTGRRAINHSSNGKRQGLLFEASRLHADICKKIFRKDLEQTMLFNMKVVLPSGAGCMRRNDSSLTSMSTISKLFKESIDCDPTLSRTNNTSCLGLATMVTMEGTSRVAEQPSESEATFGQRANWQHEPQNAAVLLLYQQLFQHRATKKYSMILKKQINNMNMFDSKRMNDFLKRLIELEAAFNKVVLQDPRQQAIYLTALESLLFKIQVSETTLLEAKTAKQKLQKQIQYYEKTRNQVTTSIDKMIEEMSVSIMDDYRLFMTGDGHSQRLSSTQVQSNVNNQVEQSRTTIQQFKELAVEKYKGLYSQYKFIQNKKKQIESHLNQSNE